MKHGLAGWVAFGMFALGGGSILAGCPIYPDHGDYRVCTSSGCYDCPNNYYSYDCNPWQCSGSYDCPSGYSCEYNACTYTGGQQPSGTSCTSPSDCPTGDNCGTDGVCHPGDCSASGCPSGYICKLAGGAVSCVPDGTSGDGSVFTGCTSDNDCASTGAGSKCLDGSCVAPADQCSDATQCPNGEDCVAGACTPKCSASQPCPTGYSCDTGKGVCTGNPTPCGDLGGTCSGGTTCVDEHCVSPCGAGNSCPTGEVCVDNGCIPDQRPQFVCDTNGDPGDGGANKCATGSTCLHHNCYISCAGDAGSCTGADQFNVCKNVSENGQTYAVCGSSSNLGSDCDPTQQIGCLSSQVCIDGFCR